MYVILINLFGLGKHKDVCLGIDEGKAKREGEVIFKIICIQRLVANGLVPGAIVDEEAPPKLLLEKLVEVVRLCADTSDDATLTQTVKV